jgi:hypothetical protein
VRLSGFGIKLQDGSLDRRAATAPGSRIRR